MTNIVKPIRPTELEFKSETELEQFIHYAASKEKTKSAGLERMRKLLKHHTPAKEGE